MTLKKVTYEEAFCRKFSTAVTRARAIDVRKIKMKSVMTFGGATATTPNTFQFFPRFPLASRARSILQDEVARVVVVATPLESNHGASSCNPVACTAPNSARFDLVIAPVGWQSTSVGTFDLRLIARYCSFGRRASFTVYFVTFWTASSPLSIVIHCPNPNPFRMNDDALADNRVFHISTATSHCNPVSHTETVEQL